MSLSTIASGWENFAVYSLDLKPLINPRVVITITQALTGSSTASGFPPYPNQFGFQMNCFGPTSPGTPGDHFTGYQQYVYESGYTSTQPLDNLTWITGNGGLYAYNYSTRPAIPAILPAGYSMEIIAVTDPVTFNTTGGTFTLRNGATVLDSMTLLVSQMSNYSGYTGVWPAPITALTLELVGPGGTSTTYTGGAGTITYYPGGGQSFGTFGLLPSSTYYAVPSGLSVANNTIHTSEQSNMKYSNFVLQPDGSLLQYFSYNGAYGGLLPVTLQASVTQVG